MIGLLDSITTPIAFITAFPQMSAIIASIDERFDGWLLHFYTVGFVEYLELLGILIFYKITIKRKGCIDHSESKIRSLNDKKINLVNFFSKCNN